MGSEEHHCPDCGQPVDTVVKRHKTLGIWVPTWVGGPCENPDCGASAHTGDIPGERHRGSGGQRAERPAPPAAEDS
ncbi:hypothetical protein SZN_02777 [Streptomyces zinciresistens K42]|uniref:Uncharacterized protein n=1 Tax=Streptomyces zinciresistens K42 TaxID=700597 RepID=G2G502_9ACTN|nr:hypothetical protein [Streptomyces zinciresistens]EGX61440.1 hypothetical protein SZN_02777 [Streptomyces zinciresistens K42]